MRSFERKEKQNRKRKEEEVKVNNPQTCNGAHSTRLLGKVEHGNKGEATSSYREDNLQVHQLGIQFRDGEAHRPHGIWESDIARNGIVMHAVRRL